MLSNFFKVFLFTVSFSMSGLASAGLIYTNSNTGSIIGNSITFTGFSVSLSGGGLDTGTIFSNNNGIYNSNTSNYPTANNIVFTFDQLVDNVAFSFSPFGLSDSGRGDLWVEVFNGSTSLGMKEILDGNYHTENLFSFGPMTSFVVNNGCQTGSGDTSCSWFSVYSDVSYDVVTSRAVSEPSTIAVLLLGMMGLMLRRVKKQS